MSTLLRQYLAVVVAGGVAGALVLVALALGGVLRPASSTPADQPVADRDGSAPAVDRRGVASSVASGVATAVAVGRVGALVVGLVLLVPWAAGLGAVGAVGFAVGGGVIAVGLLAVLATTRGLR